MSLQGIKVISGLLFGFTAFSIGGSMLGEVIATMAPVFPQAAALAVLDLGLPYEAVAFPTTDGDMLRGWFFPAQEHDAPAILYAPATSHDQRSGMSLVEPFHNAGYHVLLFSYRGHGLSDGNPFGFTYGAKESQDIDAAVRFLYVTKGISRIGAIGHSAGAVSVILSAARNPRIGAVMAASPFASMEEVWETNRPAIIPRPFLDLTIRLSELLRGYSRRQVRPQDVIAQISPRPLILMHGSEDRRITQNQAMRLFAAAKEPKSMWLVDGADHGEVRFPVLDDLMPDIIAFFDEALRGPSQVVDENWDSTQRG
jgi:alpha-beta hydrolase superfamily lysophospholipase